MCGCSRLTWRKIAVLCLIGAAAPYTRISELNASSVPGSTQTAVAGSSGAANPRVPVPKLLVRNLSPTLAGRRPDGPRTHLVTLGHCTTLSFDHVDHPVLSSEDNAVVGALAEIGAPVAVILNLSRERGELPDADQLKCRRRALLG